MKTDRVMTVRFRERNGNLVFTAMDEKQASIILEVIDQCRKTRQEYALKLANCLEQIKEEEKGNQTWFQRQIHVRVDDNGITRRSCGNLPARLCCLLFYILLNVCEETETRFKSDVMQFIGGSDKGIQAYDWKFAGDRKRMPTTSQKQ